MLKGLCTTFVKRAERQGFKGKARDNALMEFMIGAYAALVASNHPEAAHVGTVVSMVLSSRGYSECVRIANAPEPARAITP